MSFDLKELFDLEAKNGRKFDYLRFTIGDINGISRTKVVPRKFVEDRLCEGIQSTARIMVMDAGGEALMTEELKEIKYGNMNQVPCQNTLHNCSWVGLNDDEDEDKWMVGEVLCDVRWPRTYRDGSFMQGCPRVVLKKQLDSLKHLGFSLFSAFEIEFILLNPETLKTVHCHKNSCLTQLHATYESYLYTLEENLYRSGIDVKDMRIENGEGKFEFVLVPSFGIKASDDAFVAKEAIKEMSTKMGYLATFMALPRKEVTFQAGHLNLSLWTEDAQGNRSNAFCDGNDPDNMSDVFRHFIAGLIKHGPSLIALYCPTSNCYRRIRRFTFVPKFDWDIDNRKTSFRVKNDSKFSTYLEVRRPSSACNYYLATAATLVAGMDGIKNKLPLQEKNAAFYNKNFKRILGKEYAGDFPECFEDALSSLETNQVMREGLGEELIKWFVRLKRELEIPKTDAKTKEEGIVKERALYVNMF